MKKLKPGSFTLSPIISAYLKIPIGKQYIHLDTRYEDKVLNFYVYMRFSF
ncbi:MAG: hypothetical protein GY765_42765 [bacterium]|nr:hypothetical protein [bacterium]